MVTNVYVDGFNLYYGALKGTKYKWLDLGALMRRVLPKDEIGRIRYFTAVISARPGDPDQGGPARQQAYLRALETVPRLTVHLGEFYIKQGRMPLASPPAIGPRTVEVIKTEEKSSDVALGAYMMLDACRGDCDAAVLVSNDSDFREPLRLVRDELGMVTGVVNPHPSYKRSRALDATFFKQLRPTAVRAAQLPRQLEGIDGRAIHCPPEWS